jgi:hypothetical protein
LSHCLTLFLTARRYDCGSHSRKPFSKHEQKIKTIHVNLVDLVDVSRDAIELFPSLEELREYTIGSGKFFPKRSAYAGGVLKFLLREIL